MFQAARGEEATDLTCHPPDIKTALRCFTSLKLPSVALYRVEYTFAGAFDSFRPHIWNELRCPEGICWLGWLLRINGLTCRFPGCSINADTRRSVWESWRGLWLA
jgi:hypothetical protein